MIGAGWVCGLAKLAESLTSFRVRLTNPSSDALVVGIAGWCALSVLGGLLGGWEEHC